MEPSGGSLSATATRAPAASLRHRLLDYAFLVLAGFSIVEIGALVNNLATHPDVPGIVGQSLLPRIILGLIAGPSMVLFSVLLRWRAPKNAVSLYLLLLGISEIGAQFVFDFGSSQISALILDLFILFAGGLGAPSVAYLMLQFPTGMIYPPRWKRWVAIAAVLKVAGAALDIMSSPSHIAVVTLPFNPLYVSILAPFQPLIAATIGVRGILLPFLSLMGIVSLVLRYRTAEMQVRQQIKWVIWAPGICLFGAIVALVAVLSGLATSLIFVALAFFTLAQLMLLASLTIAILRYHLFDIDYLINRTLVYIGLTVIVIGLYGLVVGSLSVLFETSGNLLIALFATSLVAILFQPVRNTMQRGVNRLLYGPGRDDPYLALARLGQRLEATLAPDAVLPTIVETVAQVLKLPYVAIELLSDQQPLLVTEYGNTALKSQPAILTTTPLIYRGELIGQLVLAPRAVGEPFAPADRRLVKQFAHQAGVAAYAVRLTHELQRSRERLVTAREEERRRIRRDLHDGLGPTLAAQTLKVGAARALLAQNPMAADQLLAELERDMETALIDIRRLVYDLRPPALDELGLVAAIRETIAQYNSPRSRNGVSGQDEQLQICIEAPEHLPPLPAAVEVAVYRIVQEALTNVVRHARAHTCNVRLKVTDTFQVEISDDGSGLPEVRRSGIGIASMRERAAELGGVCVVEPRTNGGTQVHVELPLMREG